MTVTCFAIFLGSPRSNFEPTIKKKLALASLSLFCSLGHHAPPLRPPRYSLGLWLGPQRCPTSQATLTTAQKNLLAQKSRFDLIWNRSASHKWWEAVFSSWDQMSLFLGYISKRKRAFAFIFFAKVIWGHEWNWAMHRSLFGATSILPPTDITMFPWSCTLSYGMA